MKENIYSHSMTLYTAAYSLILVSAMLLVIFLGTGLKYYRLVKQFKKEVTYSHFNMY